MDPPAFVQTAILIAFFVLWAGVYGVCYCIARVNRNGSILTAAYASYSLQCATALALLLSTPLAMQWKALVVVTAFAYLWIPPITWRYLVRLHQDAA